MASILRYKGLWIVPLLYLIFLSIAFSKTHSLFITSVQKKLANSKEWKDLLRYERSLFGLGREGSAISDKDFFLSPSGRHNPLAELVATVAAMEGFFENTNPNIHALCRFPARYRWLRENIQLKNLDEKLKQCSEYQRWNAQGQIESISIYFATGYFGNPASFFGHPLLKFNRKDDKLEFMDASLNYGAMTPGGENPILYVLKGLFGGYTASFTRHDFFYHNHNYSEIEMRDLWEYRLNLDKREVQLIIDITWELLGKNHPYYFLVDNCAFRMTELLENVFKKPLLFKNRLYAIPIDLFDNLAKGKRIDGQPMVSSIRIIPSRYTRLSRMYLSLEGRERDVVKSIIEDGSHIKSSAFKESSSNSQAKITETLISYYIFQKLKGKSSKKIESKRLSMIRARFKVNGESGFQKTSYQKSLGPHRSVNSFGVGLSQGYSSFFGNFQELIIRPALYDELNPSIARPNNTSLEVFKTRLRHRKSEIKVRSLDIGKFLDSWDLKGNLIQLNHILHNNYFFTWQTI